MVETYDSQVMPKQDEVADKETLDSANNVVEIIVQEDKAIGEPPVVADSHPDQNVSCCGHYNRQQLYSYNLYIAMYLAI